MRDDFYRSRRSGWTRLTAFGGWVALAGGLLAVAVYMNVNPVASARWVTLAGTPNHPDRDFVELEMDSGGPPSRDRTVRLRINRSVEVRGAAGIAYRSFDGVANIDCVAQQARYTQGMYYKEPNFQGRPTVRNFARADQPTVALSGFKDGAARQVVRLACG